jgi:hypothetical protein
MGNLPAKLDPGVQELAKDITSPRNLPNVANASSTGL